MKLPERDVKIFDYFLHWLYSGKLSGFFGTKGGPSVRQLREEAMKAKMDPDDNSKASAELRYEHSFGKVDFYRKMYDEMNKDAPILALVSLYGLADFLLVPQLEDHIVNFIFKVYGDSNNPFWSSSDCVSIMSEAYNIGMGLPAQSRISSVIVKLTAGLPPISYTNVDVSNVNPEFLFKCMAVVRDIKDDCDEDVCLDGQGICPYHMHNNTEACSLDDVDFKKSEHEQW